MLTIALLQTVAPGEAAQRAQPIPQQTVNKRIVWLLFGGGAAAIYGSALLLERNRRFFPAIYKANETMRRAKEQTKVRIHMLCSCVCTHWLFTPATMPSRQMFNVAQQHWT